jgi:prolyl-tRNA synthetase
MDTPNTPTIATLVDLMNEREDLRRPDREWVAADTLKNVVVTVRHPDGSAEPLVIGVPGDRDVDPKRLEATLLPAVAEPFTEDDFARYPQLAKGYIGPGVLGEDKGVRYLLDPRVAEGTAWLTGADEPGRHVMNLVAGRDFTGDGTIDVADVREGDPCPQCGSAVHIARGIEIGHIFQLGRKYANALDLKVLDQDGKEVVVTMGSYGIGVTRCMAAIAEATADDLGLCWPRSVAPADVHIVIAGKPGSEQFPAGEQLAADLEVAGLRVMLDDRVGISPGVKFKDAELLGMPVIVVLGRGLVDGTVEVKQRRTGERADVPLDDIVGHLQTALATP